MKGKVSNMNWTKEQQRIIDLKNSNLLVSAAAGSGKTAVMVERIIQLVKSGENIDNFLVVTFTKAAANGMRRKIQKSLTSAVTSREGNTKHLRKQLNLLNKSMITTIDSFCMDVVKKNFFLANIEPNFRVGDSNELDILLTESIDEALEDAYSTLDDNFKILIEGFTNIRGDEELVEIIIKAYKFILSFPDPFGWLNKSSDMLDCTEENLKKSVWFKELRNHIEMMLQGAMGFLNTAHAICCEVDGPYLYVDALDYDMKLIQKLIKLLDSDFSEFVTELNNFKAQRAPSFKAEKYPEVNIEKQIEIAGGKINGKQQQGLRDKYKETVKSINKLLIYGSDFKLYAEDIKKMHGSIGALASIIVKVDEKYKEKKSAKTILDYNDLEHFALKILRASSAESSTGYEPSSAAMNYKNKFNYIFIDEYQDSNSLQEAIIDQIKRESNLFMVGDVKQSIYKFRLADPSIFNNKYDTYEKDRDDLPEGKINRIIDLNKNFRSRYEILDATNFIFNNIMTKELGEIDYSEEVFLNPGAEFETRTNVELSIIDMDSKVGEEEYLDNDSDDEYVKSEVDEEIESMQTAELEALYAAQKIKDLLKTHICESGKSETRTTEFKDIVILLRSPLNWAGIFEERFKKEDIPFYFDGGRGYYETLEVQVLLNVLKLMDNMRQDIPLISVMRSPIGNFTTEEILEVKLKFPQFKYYVSAFNSYARIADEIEKGQNSDDYIDYSLELAYKLKKLRDQITEWSYKSRYSHLSDLIWSILIESKYYYFVGSLPNGKTRQANLRMLADKADDYEKTSMRGLFKFLRYIEKMNKKSNDTGTAKTLGENDNVVRLMSIHKSKGLEFPVVILCGANKQFNLQDTRQKILFHKICGIGPKCIDVENRTEKDTLARVAIQNMIKKENLSEEMRVLYVAMTRAVDKLIMVGTVKKLENVSKKWRRGHSKYFVLKGIKYLDWIGSCLFEKVNFQDLEEVFHKGQQKNWNVNRITRSSLSTKMNEELDNKNERIQMLDEFKLKANSEYYDEITRRLEYTYPFESSVKVPNKLSVTEIKNLKEEDFKRLRFNIPGLEDFIEYDETRDAFNLDKKITGAEVGTTLHMVMEHIDLNKSLSKESILEQINEMINKRLLTEQEAKVLKNTYADKIEMFFKSTIGTRMKNAKMVYREAPFVLRKNAQDVLNKLNKDDLVLVQGIIDCYFLEDGEAVIVDYKTDAIDESNSIDLQVEELVKIYRDQINLYKEALEKIKGIKVKESYLYLFSVGKEVLVN